MAEYLLFAFCHRLLGGVKEKKVRFRAGNDAMAYREGEKEAKKLKRRFLYKRLECTVFCIGEKLWEFSV